MKKIPAKKRGFFIYPLLASFIPLTVLYVHRGSLSDIVVELMLSLSPAALLIWVYISTAYSIEKHFFYYRSAFIKGKLYIYTITRLDVGKSLWVGTKPALATKGIIITFNQYDSIYVAPQSNSELVAELVAIHPSIEVIDHDKK